MECRKAKAREWRVRLLEDLKEHKNGIMITLTFSNESIRELATDKLVKGLTGYTKDNKIAKLALRRWLERWRQRRGKDGKSLRHWLVTELGSGETEHLHLHGIVWTNEGIEEIRKRWKYGNVWHGTWVNEQTINYSTKYVYKIDEKHKNYKSIVLTSDGIGKNYLNRTDKDKNTYKENKTREHYKTSTGHKIAMPIYWRNKIYNEEEREKLWIEKLDKKLRWVDGQKIDISNGEEEYWKALKEAQKKNKKLGYGDDNKDWDAIKYENALRQLKINERIKKGYIRGNSDTKTKVQNNSNTDKDSKGKAKINIDQHKESKYPTGGDSIKWGTSKEWE